MKRYMIWTAFCFITTFVACEKNEPGNEYDRCENCTYTFQQHAQLDRFRVAGGNALVFTYKQYWDWGGGVKNSASPYSALSFEVAGGTTFFNYGNKEIAGDKVSFHTMCISCGTVSFEPVGGRIQGRKIDDRTWLVDGNVFLESPNGSHRDTLSFKGFFTKI
ncbi:hypothetical protein GCM10007415_05530 [Parapedobacter pyrenivorans]|uniref:Uncharacterized protein n=1 Tax=Parapedobacter pyrenivorans TaxID=1305674 RepID=A0A917HEF1_9SPHI|nr:hypothetical protein [Parapedobacter pyrenivorans]GGG76603.1 hypothetical protein GCM10007415_05530 [Parapedobacter pyrenivorans]